VYFIYVSFNNNVSSSGYLASNEINWKDMEGSNHGLFVGTIQAFIRLEGLRKTMKLFSPDGWCPNQGLNHAPPK
jgi:hypothetical protein